MDEGAGDAGEGRVELLAALLLGVAATLTAVSAFFSAVAGGDELAAFNTNTAKLTDANFFYQRGNDQRVADTQLFVAFLEAVQAGDEPSFITDLMDEDLEAAVEDWSDRDDLLTPLESDLYDTSDFDAAEELQAEADQALEDAADAGERGDRLDLSTVIFAASLFVGGIVSGFRRRRLQVGLLGVGAALTAFGTLVMLAGL